jgi:hypothetical protein
VAAEIVPASPSAPLLLRAYNGFAYTAHIDPALAEVVFAAALREGVAWTSTYIRLHATYSDAIVLVEIEYDGAPNVGSRFVEAGPQDALAAETTDPLEAPARILRDGGHGRVRRLRFSSPLRTVLRIELGAPCDLPTLRLCARCGDEVPWGIPCCTRCAPSEAP